MHFDCTDENAGGKENSNKASTSVGATASSIPSPSPPTAVPAQPSIRPPALPEFEGKYRYVKKYRKIWTRAHLLK